MTGPQRPLSARFAPDGVSGRRRRAGLTAVVLGAALVGIDLRAANLDPRPALEAIQPDKLAEDIGRIAGDEMQGRNTPTRGLDAAAELLAGRLGKAGLKALAEDGSFFHRYPLECVIVDPQSAMTLVDAQGRSTTLELGRDFTPLRGSAEGRAEGQVAFVGYGIEARDERYDDYAGRNVPGRVALCFWHEPRETTPGRAFDGKAFTRHSAFEHKGEYAKEHGAVALLVVTDPLHHQDTAPNRFQFPYLADSNPHNRPLEPLGIPMAHVSLEVAEKLVGRPLAPLQEQLDERLRGAPLLIDDVTVTLEIRFRTENVLTQNVVACIPGRPEPGEPEEAVIISAHYDHIGISSRGEIFNGADDNGSGTAALLAIAEAWADSGIQPTRRVIFAFFSGEEKGLLGAKAYVERPPFPLDRTVAILNMDMIGRYEKRRNEITAVGKKQNPNLFELAASAGRSSDVGLRVVSGGDQYIKRSDHYPFYQQEIPFLFFIASANLHDDYHRPGDTSDKIDDARLAKAARLIFMTSFKLATTPFRPRLK